MTSSIFGVPYTDITQVFLSNGVQPSIDAGSFADDGSSPPLSFTATINGGAITVGGVYAAITGVIS